MLRPRGSCAAFRDTPAHKTPRQGQDLDLGVSGFSRSERRSHHKICVKLGDVFRCRLTSGQFEFENLRKKEQLSVNRTFVTGPAQMKDVGHRCSLRFIVEAEGL